MRYSARSIFILFPMSMAMAREISKIITPEPVRPQARKRAKGSSTKKKQRKLLGHRLVLRNTRLSDYPDIQEIMDAVYPSLGGA